MVSIGNKASISAALRWSGLSALNYASQKAGRKSGFVVNTTEDGHLAVEYVGPKPNRVKMAKRYLQVLTEKGAQARLQGDRVLVAA